jgi:hypothetical protein
VPGPTSMSFRASDARMTRRPMRPKPLMPMRIFSGSAAAVQGLAPDPVSAELEGLLGTGPSLGIAPGPVSAQLERL